MSDNPFDKPRTDYEAAHSAYLEASQRFDYYVAGLCIAIVGYLGSRYASRALDGTPRPLSSARLFRSSLRRSRL
jgi:hypothetical protein